MGNNRKNGNDGYNFDYFERMNQRGHSEPPRDAGSQRKSGPKRPPEPPSQSKQRPPNRQQAEGRQEQKNRRIVEEQRRNPERRPPPQTAQNEGPPKRPPRPPDSAGRSQQGNGPPRNGNRPVKGGKRPPPPPPKKSPPKKPPKPKKEKPYLTPEQRRKRRKKKLILFYISLFVAVVVTGIILSVTVLFKVDTIEVEGESRYSKEEILATSELQKGVNLFMMDTKTASEKIQKALPYVGAVKISRKLPGKIVIHVDDVVIAGAVKNSSGYLVMGANGRALEQVSVLPENCPSIVGVDLKETKIGDTVSYANEEQKKLFEELATAIEENEMDKVTEIDISDVHNVQIVYDGRITMKFGLPTDLSFKLQFAKTALGMGEISDTTRGTMDLSLAASDQQRIFFNPDYTVSGSNSSSSSASSANSSTASSGTASSPAASSAAA